MAATEDDLAKKQVQEAVWAWAGRVIVLAVTFGFGFFAAWVLWGSGATGAPALREKVVAAWTRRSSSSRTSASTSRDSSRCVEGRLAAVPDRASKPDDRGATARRDRPLRQITSARAQSCASSSAPRPRRSP